MPPHQSFLGGRAVLATVAPKASGTPTGTVTFRTGSKILGMSPLNGGTAKFSTAALAVGRHCITPNVNGRSSREGIL
jgi:hypothetical protein